MTITKRLIMIKHIALLRNFVSKRLFSSCCLPLEPQTPSFSSSVSHMDLCVSLLDQLLSRGLVSSAHKVIKRLILKSSSIPEANAVIDYAFSRGMGLNWASYGCFIQELVISGDVRMAEALYLDYIFCRRLAPDCNLLNSMIICYCKLRKLKEAKSCFDKVVESRIRPWVGSINALINGCLEQDSVLEAYGCFCKFSEISNVKLELGCYNRLVNGLCGRGFLDEGLDVFDTMIEQGISPTVHVCKSVITSFCKWGRSEEAEILCTEIESYGFVVDEFMYTFLINSYCKGRNMKMAMRLFMRMLKMGYAPDRYTYNTLIHGFFNLGLFMEGWALHDKMVSSGLKPDVVTYQIMLNNYCRDGKVNLALMLLNDMPRHGIAPNVHCYTVLIAALCKKQRFEELYSLYHKMLNGGVVPDNVLFFTLVKNHPEGDGLYFALTVLQTIAKESCNIDIASVSCPVRPQSATDAMVEIEHLLEKIAKCNSHLADTVFNIYLIALSMGGKLDAACCCMEKMISLHLLPSVTAFNSFIKLLTQEGRVEDVESLLEVMQDHGLVPNSLTFSIIVSELCKRDDFQSAIDVLDQIEERGIKPNVAVYDSIITSLGRQKMIHEAESLFYRMLKSGIDPDETVFVTMINAYSKNGWAKKAYGLFEKIREHDLQPSYRAYTALIPGLIKKNMTQKGCVYLNRMLKDGFMPDVVLYTSLIQQFLRKREFEFAFQLVYLMERSNIEKDLVTYMALVSGICRNLRCFDGKWYLSNEKSHKGKEMLFHLLHQTTILSKQNGVKNLIRTRKEMKLFALSLIQKIRTFLPMSDLYLYNRIISVFCWARCMGDAYEHLTLMQREGVHPDTVTFTILIDGHIRYGEVDHAVTLFNKMNADGFAPDRMLFNTLIRGFCRVGRMLDALSLSQMMQKRGFVPSKNSYEKLLSSFCATRSSLHALRICEDMIHQSYYPCRYNLQWLISVLCNDNKWDEVQALRGLLTSGRTV